MFLSSLMAMAISTSNLLTTQKDYGRFSGLFCRNVHKFIGGVGLGKKEMIVNERKRVLTKCHMEENVKGEIVKSKYFVEMMRESKPYFRAHRGSTFVVNISTQIVDSSPFFDSILEDISLLHGLGIKFILIPGTHVQMDKLLVERGIKPKYVGRHRVTNTDSLNSAMDSASRICNIMEAKLSPRPIASGNFLAAKKRGVVDGMDYEATGEVKKINVGHIRERLDKDCIVILSNLGYSSCGKVLNCNSYEVATACALAIEADKLICIVDSPIMGKNEHLLQYLTLQDADTLVTERVKQNEIVANGAATYNDFVIGDQEKRSVPRVHLLDGTKDGVLLLELFQLDGVGTMVASDLYEETQMGRESSISGNFKLSGLSKNPAAH